MRTIDRQQADAAAASRLKTFDDQQQRASACCPQPQSRGAFDLALEEGRDCVGATACRSSGKAVCWPVA